MFIPTFLGYGGMGSHLFWGIVFFFIFLGLGIYLIVCAVNKKENKKSTIWTCIIALIIALLLSIYNIGWTFWGFSEHLMDWGPNISYTFHHSSNDWDDEDEYDDEDTLISDTTALDAQVNDSTVQVKTGKANIQVSNNGVNVKIK